LCFSFIIVSGFHLSLASWLLFSNKSSVQFSSLTLAIELNLASVR